MIFNNERRVVLTADGRLKYFHLDKLDVPKGNIRLASSRTKVHFIYKRNLLDIESARFRIETQKETFVFKPCKKPINFGITASADPDG